MRLYEKLAAEYKDIFPSSREKVDFIENFLKEGELQRILDIGCASGEFACQLSSASRKITGIDLDPFMIEEAKAQSPPESDITIHFEQAEMLRFLSDSAPDRFDLVSCLGNTIVYLDGEPELNEFLCSAKKALKKQGSLIIQILNYSNPVIVPGFTFPRAETGNIEFKREYVSLEDPGELGFKTYVKDKSTGETGTDLHRHNLFSSSRIAQMAKDIGFVNTHIFGGYDGKECEKSDFFHLLVLEK
ncbi:class I SAM-dependent methyltransferase [Spirochaeta isovalerica]|uniref:SAM-dependent methyltransferase n=1 Tax=Spirochaeta isovalerica TaxID=150 RepID=A0A841R7E1_9SPIO|nr:class I SAM-dependent methyltransferase [Spirochaeta isovalerica]MBB6481174.1 SAM-dependent methyltransferase [Spirochaeta isovalerica]